MFQVHRCSACKGVCGRSECLSDPDGVFGPELLCPHCGGLVRQELTRGGWFVALLLGVAVAGAVAALNWPR